MGRVHYLVRDKEGSIRGRSGRDARARGLWIGRRYLGDGRVHLFQSLLGGVSRVPQNGGKLEIVTVPDSARQEQGHRWPEMLPDGDSILFSIMKNFGASDAETGVLSIKTRAWRTILPNASNAHYLPTGHLVYVREGTLMAVPFNLKSLSITGSPAQVLHGVLANQDGGYGNLAVARAGK